VVYQHTFDNSIYQNCNQAYQGGIFHLEKGVKIQITGTGNKMFDNSAIQGGFAFLNNSGTSIELFNEAQINGSSAYYGGAFALYNQAELEISDASINHGNVFDGVIYFEDRSKVTITNVSFKKNKAVERGVLSSHTKS
jgi:hypothetical protein